MQGPDFRVSGTSRQTTDMGQATGFGWRTGRKFVYQDLIHEGIGTVGADFSCFDGS